MVKANPIMERECYAQSLKVIPYSLKTPISSATQIDEVLNFPEEYETE